MRGRDFSGPRGPPRQQHLAPQNAGPRLHSIYLGYTGRAGSVAARAAGAISNGKRQPTSIDATMVHEIRSQGFGATEIAEDLGTARASVYRVLA
jgi:DNA invertase Pin-like site-specific DNA recombinase